LSIYIGYINTWEVNVMADEKKPKVKRGRKPGTKMKEKTTDSVMKVFQKEYDKLIEEKKKIEKKMKVFEKSGKELGFKLSKRIGKIKDEILGKKKRKPGRKKKAIAVPEVKSEA
jgi:hypothetical protein